MKRYEAYKDSGVDWIGEIPEHWECKRLGALLTVFSSKNHTDKPLLSITREKGVILRDLDDETENHNFIPDDLSGYKLIKEGQFGMNKMKAWQGSYGISDYDGIVSPAYFIFNVSEEIYPNFFHLAIRSKFYVAHFGSASDGVRIGQWDLSKPRMREIPFFIPPLPEQTNIAKFLDDKTAKIDQLIGIKQKEIELLKERRQILIQQAVTKGLDTTVPMKNSGVDWIGEIPEHWEVRKLKQVCKININSLDERTNPNYDFEYIDIGSVTYENGIINKEFFLFKNAPSRARRIAKEGDTIVSTVRTYLKAIDFVDKSKSNYIFSTGFAVLEPNNKIYPKYLFSFIKSDAFTEQVSVNSKGMSYPAINSTELGAQKVLYLPYEEQTQIVSYLEDIEAKIAKAITLKEQEIDKLREYKTVLIDQVVTGKVKIN